MERRRELVLADIARQHQRIHRDLNVRPGEGGLLKRKRFVEQVKADVVHAGIQIRKHDHADAAHRIEPGEGAIAARPAVVPHDAPRRP